MNQSEVKVQVKNDVYQAKTRIISGDERESVWKMMAELLILLTMIIWQRRSAIYRSLHWKSSRQSLGKIYIYLGSDSVVNLNFEAV